MQKDVRLCVLISAMVLGLGATAQGLADSAPGSTNPLSKIHFYAAGHVGATYRYLKHTTTVKTEDAVSQEYRITGGDNTLADFGIRAGIIMPLSQKIYMQIGPAFYATNTQNVSGTYYQENHSNPDYNFAYKVKTHRIMGELRVYYQPKQHFAMFVGGGAGRDEIKSSAFNYTPVEGGLARPGYYKDYAVHHAAFSITGGVNFPVNNRFDIELGINHVWLGEMSILRSAYGDQYNPIDLGKLSPTTFWAEIGLHF